ncbi:acyl-CoA dehydrogenase [Solimonas terrae]|uniref:Acyl-[acyl-carrier-protein] dehydrogenase MbtN n=2 Tax=Solimonas terrae TaxID=1396819 RepID=A0A6M2BNR3_9GAMM|nr:acyl-CoA dehydrogenase family protein [Solimonas terrae]NGY04272.1 acyl-CoA dehydrogenase [Solimonas terrae]
MIPRTLFSSEHEDFRSSFRRFLEDECVPQNERWEEQQFVDRAAWQRAGELGFLCVTMPEEFGGAGVDRRYSVILMEEQGRAGLSGPGWGLHSDIVANYINSFGTREQKLKWLPPMARGEVITAIAMTEPGTGSDLQAVKTWAQDDGDDLIINGSKIFITNGYNCDMAIVVCKTGDRDGGAKSISLVMIEADRPGFSKGKPLKKMGMKGQDTCELFFENVRVPKANILGAPGMGFAMLMKELAWERLQIAIGAVCGIEYVLKTTIDYVKQRQVFGRAVASYQNTRFKLAEMKTEGQIAQVYVDRCIELMLENKLSPAAAAAAKYWCSDVQGRIVDECVQLHGGYGFMMDYPIARAYCDSRAQRIYGGTNEIMKELISRTL